MDFFQYRTAYEFHHRQGTADEPPAQAYHRWQAAHKDLGNPVADRLRTEGKEMFFEAESQWYAADCPYYKIWPGVIPLLANVNVEIPCEYLRLPFKCFSVRLPKLENPLRIGAENVVQSFLLYEHSVDDGRRWLLILLDIGVVSLKGTPKILAWHANCTASETLDSLFDPSGALVSELGKGPVPPELVAQCFKIAISICFLATGGDKLIEPEVLSKDLARYLEARRKNDATQADRLIAKARRHRKHGWNVGEYERSRPITQRDGHDVNAEGGHHAPLSHQHQRRAHFRLLATGKVTFVRQTTVRPDLPPPDRPPGYDVEP